MRPQRAAAVAICCVCSFVVLFVSILPADVLPITGYQHHVEHLTVFGLLGALMGFALRSRLPVQLLVAAGFSLMVELVQIPLPTRHARLDDFLTNCAAMVLGAVVARFVRRRWAPS